MSERIIQAMPVHHDELVLRHSYPIRVQNAIIQNAIASDGLKLTATGRLNEASVKRILDDIKPVMGLGRELHNSYRKRESDVYKLEDLRNKLIELGVVKVDNGKLRVQDDAQIKPSHLFNQQLLPQIVPILADAEPMFTRLGFKPFSDYLSAIAAGEEVVTALNIVSEHTRNAPQQKSVHSSVISPGILVPFLEIGLLVNNPVRTTDLWNEVIRIS